MVHNGSLRLDVGEKVVYEGEEYFIRQVNDLNNAVLIHPKTKVMKQALISDIEGCTQQELKPVSDLKLIPDHLWDEAMKRFEIIKPLLVKGRTREMVSQRAAEYECSVTTVYNWIKRYESNGKVTDLLRAKRSDKDKTTLNKDVAELVKRIVNTEYKTAQKKSIAKVCREVARQCHELGLKAPHCNTVRKWISKEHPKDLLRIREGKKEAAENYSPIRGSFPGADWPLSFVQIDHTRLDIQLCDDHWRRPVGRPWITVVFDVFSRMVLGFRVGFDSPSALITGLAISHAVLPKEDWLAKYNVNGEWPCWGIPDTIHMDNAKEFRGKLIQRACDQYGINIEWRPVARPNYGAHVERYLGTLAEELKGVSGATFSNIFEKGNYDSEKNAVLTLSELEEWLTVYIVGVYHNREHSSLGMSPLEKFKKGILGDDHNPGKGLPAKLINPRQFRLDFLPFVERTIQREGVVIDDVQYYADVLRRWINAPDPEKPSIKRKFVFRRDPRDISLIWFYDPNDGDYYPVHYRNTAYPPISVWELRAAQAKLKEERSGRQDESQIFSMIGRMREIEEKAARETKRARRNKERKKPTSMSPLASKQPESKLNNMVPESDATKPVKVVRPFDDLDEML